MKEQKELKLTIGELLTSSEAEEHSKEVLFKDGHLTETAMKVHLKTPFKLLFSQQQAIKEHILACWECSFKYYNIGESQFEVTQELLKKNLSESVLVRATKFIIETTQKGFKILTHNPPLPPFTKGGMGEFVEEKINEFVESVPVPYFSLAPSMEVLRADTGAGKEERQEEINNIIHIPIEFFEETEQITLKAELEADYIEFIAFKENNSLKDFEIEFEDINGQNQTLITDKYGRVLLEFKQLDKDKIILFKFRYKKTEFPYLYQFRFKGK